MIECSPLPVLLWSLGLTFLFETITLFFRFGCGLEWASVSRSTVGVVTRGVRIHHGFLGVAVVLAAFLIPPLPGSWRGLFLATGTALFLSDMIHHFLVLWPLTGTPQFHLLYRQSQPAPEYDRD